ncbi:hypothetical protein CBA19CS42_32295 [Caballeronia novacaledonica]|uniref:KAP NTPase domain-containing protein n=1 Tax=Caballeronia novacaledonica TaxID=1544861 RepID=A0AA37IGL1_9BURK|nr:hypothetical protein CBA19CS42_32295 [Caballeronia novacaledonica]
MRMIQKQLDPEANENAEQDREQKRETLHLPAKCAPSRNVDIDDADKTRDPVAGLTPEDLKNEVDQRLHDVDKPLPRVEVRDEKLHRVTVWFNAWKYENTNQVWAGLADAILQQVPNRLTTRAQRERFWLRLNLARVNSAAIRQRVHNYFIHRVLRTTAGLGWAIVAAIATCLLGLVVAGTSALATFLKFPGLATVGFVIVLAASKAIAVYFKVKEEPIAEVLNDLVEVPKYEGELGFVHQVEKDIRRVFGCLPTGTSLVIFIDDLDQCSPPKVAAVLEALNLFLAGDFPDCSFVFGMDSEMVAAALQSAHKDLWAALPADAKVPIGWRFMDKFVQLPFVIPPVADETQREFVDVLMGAVRSHTNGKENASTAPTTSRTSARKITNEEFREAVNRAGAFDDNNTYVQSLINDAVPLFKGCPREVKIFHNLFRFNHLLWYARHEYGNDVPSKEALCRWTALKLC